MITINFQNRSGYAKVLAEQASGQRPLYLGPARHGRVSSADVSVEQFLAYYDTIVGYTKQKREIDGNAALTVISDTGIAEISAEALLAGIVAGHFGADAQAKAQAFVALREATAAGLAAVAAERRAMLTGAALRGTATV
jgi:hypothetical protein